MEKSPISIYRTADANDAYLLKGILLEAGIDAKVVGDRQPFTGLTAAMSVDVLVTAGDENRAAEIAANFQNEQCEVSEAVDWICTECGETVPTTFDTCFKCGMDRPLSQTTDDHLQTLLKETSPTGSTKSRKSDRPQSAGRLVRPDNQRGWLETAVALSLVATYYYAAIAYVVWPEKYAESRWDLDDCLWAIVRDLQAAIIVLFLMWRSEKAWRDYGLGRPRFTMDVPMALCVVFVDYTLWILFSAVSSTFETSPSSESDNWPLGAIGQIAYLVAVCIGAFSQELLLRAYLIPRFEEHFHSTLKSVLLTTVIFAGYHIYQGPIGVLAAGLGGLVYGISFCTLRRIWPIAAAHAVFNILSEW